MTAEHHHTATSAGSGEDPLERALDQGGQLPGTDDSQQEFEGTTDTDRPDTPEDDERESGADVA